MNIRRFWNINDHKKMTLAIYGLTAFYRAQMLLVPSKKLEKHWGEKNAESPSEETVEHYRYAYIVSNEVNRIADKTPWESKCLVRAQTARFLLHRKAILTTMYLGVGKDEKGAMIAHAWLRCGDKYVTGGDGTGYAAVARFCK